MAKQFKPKENNVSAVQWNGDNAEEFIPLLDGGTATKRGRSLVISSKFMTSLINTGDWLAKDDNGKLQSYTDEAFKEKYQDKNQESL